MCKGVWDEWRPTYLERFLCSEWQSGGDYINSWATNIGFCFRSARSDAKARSISGLFSGVQALQPGEGFSNHGRQLYKWSFSFRTKHSITLVAHYIPWLTQNGWAFLFFWIQFGCIFILFFYGKNISSVCVSSRGVSPVSECSYFDSNTRTPLWYGCFWRYTSSYHWWMKCTFLSSRWSRKATLSQCSLSWLWDCPRFYTISIDRIC